MRAKIPVDEALRLSRLHELSILDTACEEAFDSVVASACTLLEVPAAFISFIAEDRQWIKARQGMDIEETTREIAFCAHTIVNDGVLVCPDTALDERFSDNPLVVGEPKIKFYAGSPVLFQGQPVGTLCCVDTVARNFTQDQVGVLVAMSRQVSALLDARSLTARLIESENLFSSAIETMHDGLLLRDKDCQITFANQAASDIFDCSAEELCGCRLEVPNSDFFSEDGDVWPFDEHPAMVALREGTTQTGRIMDIRSRKTGIIRSVIYNSVPLFKPDANVAYGTVCTLTDVTARKQARIALEKLNEELEERASQKAGEIGQLFSVSMDTLCISDEDGLFTKVSPAFTQNLGWTESEVLGRSHLEYLHPDDVEATRNEISSLKTDSSPRQFENRFRHKNGSYRILWWKSVPLPNKLIYSAARDITEHREMEQGLRVAVEAARSADLAKSEFLSRMSHELRTPMNAVLGYAQLIELKYDDPYLKNATESILKGGHHLLQLINQILDLSKIESGNLGLSMEPVDLFEIIDQTIDLLEPTALEAGVSLIVEKNPRGRVVVQADRQRLLQVLLNLVGNGIKYNRRGGALTVNFLPVSADHWEVHFTDTGIGIPEESRHLLFEPFQRFSDPGIEGTGLGLAISRRFAQLMGGTLELLRSGDQGSTFTLQLHKADALVESQKDIEVSDAIDALDSAGTVLYIEDNLANIKLVEAVISDWSNVHLIPAMQASVGLELSKQHLPDLIFLDIHLPDMMGDQVLERLKADPLTHHIPVVILSADATRRQIAASLERGAEEYLTKPIDLQKLYQVLQKYLPTRS